VQIETVHYVGNGPLPTVENNDCIAGRNLYGGVGTVFGLRCTDPNEALVSVLRGTRSTTIRQPGYIQLIYIM
jgi:hypothetical protein